MEKHTIFTNNSIAAELFTGREDFFEVKWIAAPAMDVLAAVKAAARAGGVVLSNPLSGVRTSQQLFGTNAFEKSVPGGRSAQPKVRSINPYLSVLLGPSLHGTVDFVSVKNVDEALTVYKKNARLRFAAHNDDAIKAFQAVDLEVLLATLATQNIPV